MRRKVTLVLPLMLIVILVPCAPCFGQAWSGILNAPGSGSCSGSTPTACAIVWASNGIPGGIPSASWTQSGSTIAASACGNGSADCTSTIQNALSACGTNHYVLLGSGTFSVSTVQVPSNCELRGSGANETILSSTNTSAAGVVLLGASANSAPSKSNDTAITGGLAAASTSITVASTSHISVGTLLSISELNDPTFGTRIGGSEGDCTWCDGNYSGTRTAGQTVLVTGVSGTTVTISPALYKTYGNTLPGWTGKANYFLASFITNGGHYYQQTAAPGSPYNCTSGASAPNLSISGGSVSDGTCTWQDMGTGTTTQPLATPFSPAATFAGVENLQIYANNTGAGTNVIVNECEYCWVHGIEGNYADGDHVDVLWSYFGEVSNNYFSNAMLHTAGTYDSCVRLAEKSSGFVIQNNILERLHVSIMLEWGASGNVIAYNYMEAGFDTSATNVVIGGVDYHGAHPMFNLQEGNVGMQIYYDSVWGTSSDNTSFRNWVQGSAALCSPLSAGRNKVSCGTVTYPFQASRAFQVSYLADRTNSIGNVIGSTDQESNPGYGSGVTGVDSVQWTATRIYDTTVYGWSVGYGEASDSGTWALDSATAYSTAFLHGNYSNITGQIVWHSGTTHTLPASFYLSSKPSWWGTLAFPAIGPDVIGGAGPGGYAGLIPAQNCYLTIMGGTDGGAGGPLTFNASSCYGAGGGGAPQPPTGLTATVQ